MDRTFSQDAADVARLARQCIGNPERKAAREHRDELVRAMMRATHAKDDAALARAKAEYDAYQVEYRRIMGRPAR